MHIVVLHHTEHIVMTHIVKPVGNLRDFQWRIKFLFACQSFLQVLTWLTHPTRNLNEGNDLFLQVTITQQAIHSLNENIDTFVAEFITSRCRYNQCIVTQLLTQQGIGNFKQSFTGSLSLAGKLRTLWHETVIEAIW